MPCTRLEIRPSTLTIVSIFRIRTFLIYWQLVWLTNDIAMIVVITGVYQVNCARSCGYFSGRIMIFYISASVKSTQHASWSFIIHLRWSFSYTNPRFNQDDARLEVLASLHESWAALKGHAHKCSQHTQQYCQNVNRRNRDLSNLLKIASW